jgi:hypothetical protein
MSSNNIYKKNNLTTSYAKLVELGHAYVPSTIVLPTKKQAVVVHGNNTEYAVKQESQAIYPEKIESHEYTGLRGFKFESPIRLNDKTTPEALNTTGTSVQKTSG